MQNKTAHRLTVHHLSSTDICTVHDRRAVVFAKAKLLVLNVKRQNLLKVFVYVLLTTTFELLTVVQHVLITLDICNNMLTIEKYFTPLTNRKNCTSPNLPEADTTAI